MVIPVALLSGILLVVLKMKTTAEEVKFKESVKRNTAVNLFIRLAVES